MTETDSVCLGCKYADWKRTANGRLHPDGSGECSYWIEMKFPPLPQAFNKTGYPPKMYGGSIQRNTKRSFSLKFKAYPIEPCFYYTKETKRDVK